MSGRNKALERSECRVSPVGRGEGERGGGREGGGRGRGEGGGGGEGRGRGECGGRGGVLLKASFPRL